MVVVNQTGTCTIPFEKFPFELVPYSYLCDIEPETKERFEKGNLWWVIIAQIGFEDIKIMGGYDTYDKAKSQLNSLFNLYVKGAKLVQLNTSEQLQESGFDAEEALKKILF